MFVLHKTSVKLVRDLTRVPISPQNVAEGKSPLFQGNPGWCKYYSIWPDSCTYFVAWLYDPLVPRFLLQVAVVWSWEFEGEFSQRFWERKVASCIPTPGQQKYYFIWPEILPKRWWFQTFVGFLLPPSLKVIQFQVRILFHLS